MSDDSDSGSDYYDDGLETCRHCSNRMPKTSIQQHVQNKHCVRCRYCNAFVLPASMNGHIQNTHQIEMLTEENQRLRAENVRLNSRQAIGFTHNFDDAEFNNLVAQNRIYSENNVIYRTQ